MPKYPFEERTPEEIDKYISLANDVSDYNERLEAIKFLSKFKCEKSVMKLYKLMIHDKIFPVKEEAFRALQNFGENVKLPRKKKGKIVKSINDKLLILHNSFSGDLYSIKDFKVRFKEKYPEIFDIYSFEKKNKFDEYILGVIKCFPKKKVKHSYSITVLFENKIESISESIEILYKNSSNSCDSLTIEENKIIISCERSSKIDLRNIIINEQNSINNQLTKSLIYYYIKIGKYNQIQQIEISRDKSSETIKLKIPNKEFDLEQILNSNFNIENRITSSDIHAIFDINQKSNSLLNALTYLLKSHTSDEPSKRFEKLWQSFNSIYYYFGNGANENECHRLIRKFIIDNKDKFTETIKLVKDLSIDELKNKIRFKDLIINDYENKEHIVSLIAFIYRYHNYKICSIIKDNLIYREEFIKDIFTLNKVESKFNQFDDIKHIYQTNKTNPDTEIIYKIIVSYLENNIKNKTNEYDIELVVLICIKYAYYLRNKIFHAEKYDLTFRVAKLKFVEDLDLINKILENLIIELININAIWIQKSI